MSRTIVDLTQLAHWPGKLTGIPRVMYEIAVRFDQERDPDVIFAVWVKEIQAMCEIDFARTMQQRGNGIAYLHRSETRSLNGPAPTNTPAEAPVKRPITIKRVLKYGIRQTGRVSTRLANKLEQRGKLITLNSYKRVEFVAGDLLYIPWGEWWDPNFIARLTDWHGQGVKLAPLIHDLGPIVQPQFSGHSTDSLTDYVRAIVPLAAVTLVVSRNTKADLTTWLKSQKLSVPRIEVFRLGEDFEFSKPAKPTDQAFTASGLKGGDYIMCVGTVELKKNHVLMYYVYKLAKQRGIKLPKLLAVGRPGWHTETNIELISKDPDTAGSIIFLHDISDAQLSWLYDHCMFTVLPSFYEGWGIPIAESVARGVPCACSNTSSMVEIAEGIVDHFSPYSTEECLAAIQKLLEPKHYKVALARTKTYKQTSWDESYRQTKEILEQV